MRSPGTWVSPAPAHCLYCLVGFVVCCMPPHHLDALFVCLGPLRAQVGARVLSVCSARHFAAWYAPWRVRRAVVETALSVG